MAVRKKFDKLEINPDYAEAHERENTSDSKPKSKNTYSFRPAAVKKGSKKVYRVGTVKVYAAFSAIFLLTLVNAFLARSGAYLGMSENVFYTVKCLSYPIIFLIPTLIYCRTEKKHFAEASSICRFSPSLVPFTALSFLLLTFVIAAEKFSVSYFFSPISDEPQINLASAENPLLVLFASAIFPAIFEEIAFRGLIRTEISEKAGGFAGIAVSSIAFALVHLDLKYFAVYLSSGIILGVAAHVSASVFPCIIIHALNNIFSLYFSSRLTFIAAEKIGNTFILISLVICIFVLLLFYLKSLEQVCLKKAIYESICKKHPEKDNVSQGKICYGKQFKLLSESGYTLHKLLRVLFSPVIIVSFVLFMTAVIL